MMTQKYKSTSVYHTLNFFFTEALQTLKARKPEAERCLTASHRVDSYIIMFLQGDLLWLFFTSSSMAKSQSHTFYIFVS